MAIKREVLAKICLLPYWIIGYHYASVYKEESFSAANDIAIITVCGVNPLQ